MRRPRCRWNPYGSSMTEFPSSVCSTQVENQGEEVQTLDYISTFNYMGIEKEGAKRQDEKLLLKLPHNGWQREMNWKDYTLKDLGMELVQPKEIQRSSNHFHVSNTGNWSSKEFFAYGLSGKSGNGFFFVLAD